MATNPSQPQLMQLIQSEDERPYNNYRQGFDNLFDQSLFHCYPDFIQPKKAHFQKIQEQICDFCPLLQQAPRLQNLQFVNLDMHHKQNARDDKIMEGNQVQIQNLEGRLKKQETSKLKSEQKSRRTTRFCSKIEEDQVCELDEKNSPLLITEINQQSSQVNSLKSQQLQKKQKKISKKNQKYIFKQKHFKKSLKISFPKKIVQMFINHYQEYLEQNQNEQVLKYNDNLKQKLKQNKKNDYTFDKEVSQIIGESQDSGEMDENLSRVISQTNRFVFSQIISETMKDQVIMRDKIAKNRLVYMVQLKVYALRCRSHKLSKKGTFK